VKLSFLIALFITFCIVQIDFLQGHGIGEFTLIKTAKGIQSIETIKPRKRIFSYNTSCNQNVKTSVRTTGSSISNCYISMRFSLPGSVEYEEILCTPAQEFYRVPDNAWICAAHLKVGDELKSDTYNSLTLVHLEIIAEPLKVYILEVRKYHNFFVGKHALLTHNTTLPWEIAIGISIPLGEAATGGAAGSFFGPIGVVGGVIIGSILGCGLQYIANQDKTYQYDAFFDAEKINAFMKGSLNAPSQSKNAPQGGGGPSNYQDPKNDEDKKRVTNEIHKSEFFKRISDRYECWRDGIYKAKRNAEKLGNGKAEYLEWDYLHNDVEAYSKGKQHLGSVDPKTLELYKGPEIGRIFLK